MTVDQAAVQSLLFLSFLICNAEYRDLSAYNQAGTYVPGSRSGSNYRISLGTITQGRELMDVVI